MKRFEFSKIILTAVMITYFVALGFGMAIIYKLCDSAASYISTAICGLFSFVGAPVAVAIGFYSYKAKAENIEKIKNGLPPIDETNADDGQIGGTHEDYRN